MKLMNRKISMGLAGGAMVVAAGLAGAAPASAATVDVDFQGNGITFTAVQADQELYCPEFDLAGEFDDVSNTGVLDDLFASGCTNDIAGSTTVTPNGTWNFATGSNVGGTVWNATITDVTAYVSAAGCSFNVGGEVDGTFDTSNQTFSVTNSDVTIVDSPSGFLCPFLGVAQGQDVEIDGSWTNVGGTITLP